MLLQVKSIQVLSICSVIYIYNPAHHIQLQVPAYLRAFVPPAACSWLQHSTAAPPPLPRRSASQSRCASALKPLPHRCCHPASVARLRCSGGRLQCQLRLAWSCTAMHYVPGRGFNATTKNTVGRLIWPRAMPRSRTPRRRRCSCWRPSFCRRCHRCWHWTTGGGLRWQQTGLCRGSLPPGLSDLTLTQHTLHPASVCVSEYLKHAHTSMQYLVLRNVASKQNQLACDHYLPCSLTKRLPSWAGLPPLLDAISDAVMGSKSLSARAAAAEAAAATLLAVR